MMNGGFICKTTASLLSAVAGALGFHRFFMYGYKETFGWLYLSATSAYVTVAATYWVTTSLGIRVALLLPILVFVAAIAALVIGLTDDRKWDKRHNTHSPNETRSGWRPILLVILTMGGTSTAFLVSMARAVGLLYMRVRLASRCAAHNPDRICMVRKQIMQVSACSCWKRHCSCAQCRLGPIFAKLQNEESRTVTKTVGEWSVLMRSLLIPKYSLWIHDMALQRAFSARSPENTHIFNLYMR